MANVHRVKPSRSPVAQRPHYKGYKDDLRADFNQSCGYCDDNDLYAMNGKGFHIDHFAPKSKFPELHNEYSNLVYACSFCNVYKGSYWPSQSSANNVVRSNGFEDPCIPAYDTHLTRGPDGQIIPVSALGEFMHKRLKLGLRRHQLIWLIAKAERVVRSLQEEIAYWPRGTDERLELLEMVHSVVTDFLNYTKELGES